MTAQATSKTTAKRAPAKRTAKPKPDPKVVEEKLAAQSGPKRAPKRTVKKPPSGYEVGHLYGATGADKAKRAMAVEYEDQEVKAGRMKPDQAVNLNHVRTVHANGGEEPKAKKASGNGAVGRVRSERGQQAVALRKQHGIVWLPDAVEMDDDELVAYITKLLKADPTVEREDERPYLRFVEKRRFSIARFNKVFDAVKAGQPVPPKSTKKAAPEAEAPKAPAKATAKKAPAKKAAPKAAPKQAASKKQAAPKAAPKVANPLKEARKSQAAARKRVRAEAGR